MYCIYIFRISEQLHFLGHALWPKVYSILVNAPHDFEMNISPAVVG